MRFATLPILIAAMFGVSPCADAQAPPRWDELPKLAASWPSAWLALVNAPLRENFEKDLLRRLDELVRAEEPTKEGYRRAENVLAAALRRSQSLRGPALHVELEDRLAGVRKDWLIHLRKAGEDAEALRLAEQWLPAAAHDGVLRTAMLSFWLDQAKAALVKSDFATAHKWLDRLEIHGAGATQIDEIRQPLHDLASAARKTSHNKTLVVAVRSLPEQMSPATAWTEVERQTLELIYDRLYHVETSSGSAKRYRPQLAAALPGGGLTASIPLRRDLCWSSGERVTSADIRHTALLMNQDVAAGRSALWRDFLDIPRLEGNPFQLNLGYRQGLFDPLASLTFWILPQQYRGKQLGRADDPDFAKAPLGSGPFEYLGRKDEENKAVAVFQLNPHDLRPGAGNLNEIRLTKWTDPGKDLGKPLPHLILDAPTDQLPALKALGYVESDARTSPRVCFLAVNQRKAPLASDAVRRAIAHGIDRQALLNQHFRSAALKGKHHATANGLFPRDSWASAPVPRVPEELFHAEQARSFARKAKAESAKLELTLKYPAADARVEAACTEVGQTIVALFQEANIKTKVQVQGLAPPALRKAIEERDFDLLYMSAEGLDDPVRLALLFDRQESAMRAGGGNYLGCDNDKLHELLRTALQHRQFGAVAENMHTIHVHLYESMPAIPLWQLDVHVLAQPSLRAGGLDPRAAFANVREWKIVP